MAVVEAVKRDIERIRRLDPVLADSAWAASALVLAAQLDDPDSSATSKSMCAKALADALDRLRELCPPERKSDGIDDLARRRRDRRQGASAAEG